MWARDYIPALKFGAKISPSEIAGMIGLPYIGDVYYLDPTNGSDSNGGKAQNDAFKTLATAYNALTTNHHDVIVLTPGGTGSGTGTVETAAITWSKSLCHLVGNVAPTYRMSRARVTTATAGLSPFITVSGNGNSFSNVLFYDAAATNYVNVRVSGARNVFKNVHFAGVGSATAGDNAGATDLDLLGAQENVFQSCTFGNHDVIRTAAAANVRFTINGSDGCKNNIFNDCYFELMADADAPRFLIVGASALDRENYFNNCKFINSTGSTSTAQTDAFTVNASPGGYLVLQDCLKIGATGWGDVVTNLYMAGTSTNATYANGIGAAVNPQT